MIEKIQTGVVVTLLTVLIWLFAEAQNPAQPFDGEVTIQLLPPAGSNLRVRLQSPNRVRLQVAGPTATIKTLEKDLQRGPITMRLGEYGLPTVPGEYNRPMIDFLGQNPLLKNHRLRIQQLDPNVIRFSVVEMLDRTINIKPGDLGNIETEGPIEIMPPTLKLSVPSSLLQGMDESSLHAVATPRINTDQTFQAGKRYSFDAVVSVPGIADLSAIKLDTEHVRMSFTVRAIQAPLTVRNVPIQIVLLPVDQNRYDITLAESLIPELEIVGPSDLIERIKRHELIITGQAVFSSDELTRQISEKTVSFDHLPDGLQVRSDPIVIAVTIKRRAGNDSQ